MTFQTGDMLLGLLVVLVNNDPLPSEQGNVIKKLSDIYFCYTEITAVTTLSGGPADREVIYRRGERMEETEEAR